MNTPFTSRRLKINHRMHAAEVLAAGSMISFLYAALGIESGISVLFIAPGAAYYAWALLK